MKMVKKASWAGLEDSPKAPSTCLMKAEQICIPN